MLPFSNPVRPSRATKDSIYPYYAGFSDEFVVDALEWVAHGRRDPLILDPWNGAGTTTRIGSQQKTRTIGLDLNPVMVLVANAELVSASDASVITPLARKIAQYVERESLFSSANCLESLFNKNTASRVKGLATAIWLHLVEEKEPNLSNKGVDEVAPMPSLFFVALFNVVRRLLSSLATSNPTWLKIPTSSRGRAKCDYDYLKVLFIDECQRLGSIIGARQAGDPTQKFATSRVADSRKIPFESESVDGIVTSPPYCTRLDYGRATIAELLVLEAIGLANYNESRSRLIGNSMTRGAIYREPMAHWGPSCVKLLDEIFNHPSRASRTYYYKSHYAYFEGISESIREASRVLKISGRVCIVAQDSYYKDLHTDLPRILIEMARNAGLNEVRTFNFEKLKSMCSINPGSSVYRKRRKPIETAILFEKG